MDDGYSMLFEENVANTVSKTVTEKIGALVERKLTELHSILRAGVAENKHQHWDAGGHSCGSCGFLSRGWEDTSLPHLP